jgi:hypothetical protein
VIGPTKPASDTIGIMLVTGTILWCEAAGRGVLGNKLVLGSVPKGNGRNPVGLSAERRESKARMEATMEATWKPHEKHGTLTERSDLPDSVFAFPKQRKEPLTDATHVRNAIARFDQTIDVSDADRELAFSNIKKAAQHYGVDMTETDWTRLGRTPHTGRTEEDRKRSAREAAATRERARGNFDGRERRRHGTSGVSGKARFRADPRTAREHGFRNRGSFLRRPEARRAPASL